MSSFFTHIVYCQRKVVVSLEKGGVRVWRILPLSGVELGGGTASESGVNVRATVTARTPPPLIRAEPPAVFCSLAVDADVALLGDSLGRVRVLSLLGDDASERAAAAAAAAAAAESNALSSSAKLRAGGLRGQNSSPSLETSSTSTPRRPSGSVRSDADVSRLELDDETDEEPPASPSGLTGDSQPFDSEIGQAERDALATALEEVMPTVLAGGVPALKQAMREHGARLWRMVGRDGQTLLHHAAAHGVLDVVQVITRKAPQAYLTRRDDNGWSALHTAASFGHAVVCEELLQRGRLSLFDRCVCEWRP